MDDAVFMSLAENIIRRVDDRYGRAAAWTTAVLMVSLPVALVAALIWWFAA